MRINDHLKPYFTLAAILAVLMLVTAFAGTFFPDIYSDFTHAQRVAESQGQDAVTLFVALPLLAVAVLWARRDDVRGPLFWVGALGYVLYVYLIYAYAGLYTILFPLYVAIVGLSIFSIIGVLNGVDAQGIPVEPETTLFHMGSSSKLFVWTAVMQLPQKPNEGTIEKVGPVQHGLCGEYPPYESYALQLDHTGADSKIMIEKL